MGLLLHLFFQSANVIIEKYDELGYKVYDDSICVLKVADYTVITNSKFLMESICRTIGKKTKIKFLPLYDFNGAGYGIQIDVDFIVKKLK